MLAVVIIIVVTVLQWGPSKPAASGSGVVTTFQPGEFRAVPNACSSVSPQTLGTYLPGKLTKVVPQSLDGAAQSLCSWTLDPASETMYRQLQVTVQAYPPSAEATGDGSATFNAIDMYQLTLAARAHPAKRSHLPSATVSTLSGLGAAGFSGLQVVHSTGATTTDIETVVTRDRNVLVTVILQALVHARQGHYGPVSTASLAAGATAVARDVVTHLS